MPRTPPAQVLEELYRLLPTLRLGWDGGRGCYGLIQLWRHREIYDIHGTIKVFREPWGDRGEIFGRPFDRQFRVPMYVIDVAPDDLFVYTDVLLAEVAKFCRKGLYRRLYEANIDTLKRMKDEQQALAEQQGEHMYWRAQRSSWRPNVVAREFLTAYDKRVLSGEHAHQLEVDREAQLLNGPSPDSIGAR